MMDNTAASITPIMEHASQLLAKMDYLGCEDRCLQAMSIACSQDKWADYARILLPLQEARRQRRMTAAEGVVRLGTTDLPGNPVPWLRRLNPGCIVVTHPHTARTADQLAQAVRRQSLYVEILFADNAASVGQWVLRSFAGPSVACVVDAPPRQWIDAWLNPPAARQEPAPADQTAKQPADWFLDACEALGDAALAEVNVPMGDRRRVRLLERCLRVVTDHEILHQTLGQAARALQATPQRQQSG